MKKNEVLKIDNFLYRHRVALSIKDRSRLRKELFSYIESLINLEVEKCRNAEKM